MSGEELTELANEAHELGLVAEAKSSLGGLEASEAHNSAAVKYVAAARRVRDPTTRRAIALVGLAHARRAACLRRRHDEATTEAPSPTPATPIARPEPPSKGAESLRGTLCVPDLLALERRLHSLGVGGRARPTLKAPVKATCRVVGSESAQDLVAQYLGDVVTENHDAQPERPSTHDREHALVKSMKRLSDENAILRSERDALAARLENQADEQRSIQEFRQTFAKKFDTVKRKLEDFRRDYPSPSNPANEISPADNQPPRSYSQLLDEIKALQFRLKQERDFSRHKDAVIARYEHWYRMLKASASKKRKPAGTTPVNNSRASSSSARGHQRMYASQYTYGREAVASASSNELPPRDNAESSAGRYAVPFANRPRASSLF